MSCVCMLYITIYTPRTDPLAFGVVGRWMLYNFLTVQRVICSVQQLRCSEDVCVDSTAKKKLQWVLPLHYGSHEDTVNSSAMLRCIYAL